MFPVTPSGALLGEIAAGPDGNVWFGQSVPVQIGAVSKITAGGAITQYPLKTDEPMGIAAGPDGNIWVTSWDKGTVFRLTPGGVGTDFGLPQTRSQPWEIAAGADGNLWFTESAGQRIDRITPDGAITQFPPPSQPGLTTRPSSIAAGADGNLWFTETFHTTKMFGRITPAGVITQFSSQWPVDAITSGPDGNLWVTMRTDGIGRVNPDGTITRFPLPRTGITAVDIVTGSDGNLWFTEANDGSLDPPPPMLGRITPTGVVTELPVVDQNGNPVGGGSIAAGPDGNLWLAQSGNGTSGAEIARVSVAKPGVRYVHVLDAGFSTSAPTAVSVGGSVRWGFYGASVHEVADATGLGTFDSGPENLVSFFQHRFTAAGSYPYSDPLHPALAGTVTVTPLASPAAGGETQTFAITWASRAPAANDVFDVQIRRPGTSSYVNWFSGTTTRSAAFAPDAGPGKYTFRARLRNSVSGAKTGYATKSISVS